MQVSGKVAFVTGGASGLGQATARALAEAGAHVVIADLADGAATAEQIGQRAMFVQTDVTSTAAVTAALDRAGELGDLAVVVNCAGIATPGRVLDRDDQPLDVEQFSRVIAVNLIGTFNVVRLGAQRMLRAPTQGEERGVIVNTASVAAFEGQIGQAAYSASKGGVAAMTIALARDLASRQIRVTTIAPGIFSTPMMAGLPQKAQDSLARQIPHPRRLGRPEEYAALVLHIVDNPMLNGEVIRLDGAIRMAPR